MRHALVLCLAAPLALAAPPAARRPVVALLPASAATPELRQLALLVEARAAELLETSGRYAELHLKQVLSMADMEGFAELDFAAPKEAEAARRALGADRVVTLSLAPKDKGLALSGAIHDGRRLTTFSALLPAGWADAVTQGSDAVARAVLKQDGAGPPKGAAEPDSKSEEALRALAACYQTVVAQPLGIENPAVLDAADLEAAIASCRKAVAADPTLRFAGAALALALAINGEDAAATKALSGIGEGAGGSEAWTLARFWLLTRYQSNEAGVAFLEDALKKRPGALIARAYLGESLLLEGDYQRALAAWEAYLAQVPGSPYAHGRRSKALARLGRHDDAIAAAKKALELSPQSRDARLQLGSRYIDAGRYDEATAALEPLLSLQHAKGEYALRLGYAAWKKGDVEAAARRYQQALDLATRPAEWRTRGRAFYDLAMVEAKRGRKDAARVALRASLQTGFKVRQVDPLLADAAREVERAEVAPADAGRAPPSMLPRESSLFPVDAFGEVNPKAKKPPAPDGLVLFRF